MLIRITNACTMGCSHCLVDAKPHGEMMAQETFEDALDLAHALYSPIILISGGEPTMHPNILSMLKEARVGSPGMTFLLLSNGEFLHEKPTEWVHELLDLVDGVQVTHDARFYPRRVREFDHKKVIHETAIRQVTPLGRASDFPVADSCKAPQCFNLRSATRSLGLAFAVKHLRSMGKFCTPSIDPDGSVRAGESPFCCKIGDVNSSVRDMEHELRKPPCNKCKAVCKLSDAAKKAVGLPTEESCEP